VNSVAFTPDGDYLLAASLNGEARIWKKDGRGETITLKTDGKGMNSARFNPGGDRVVTASDDGSVRVWRYKWQDLLDYLDSSTRVCLSIEERMNFLTEEEELACQRYQQCMQREYGNPDNSGSCTSAP
jgi:WD40 repeat protein